jgi:hypothetical protein
MACPSPFSPNKLVGVGAASVVSSASAETSCTLAVLEQVKILESEEMKQDGSANFPHIIIANPDKPEANHGFEISEINGFECRNYKRNGIHICRVSAPTQEDAWDMIVPWEKYPTIAHRAVLCRGPSQHFWHADANRYHQNDICPVTKTVHESLQTEIGNDPLRQYVWYLIVLPEGTEL